MDHLSFVFSLLLIVSVTTTTLGSVIKAKNPNGEELKELPLDKDLSLYPDEIALNNKELEALSKRSNQSNPSMEKETAAKVQRQMGLRDQDSEKFKRASLAALIKNLKPGEVFQAGQLALASLNTIAASEYYSRAVVIGIENQSGYKWGAIQVHFKHGTSDVNLPKTVTPGKSLLYEARKKSWSWTGVSGVMAYCIPDIKKTLAVMFSVPFSGFYSNWFAVKLYDGEKKPNDALFDEMYKNDALKGDYTWHNDKSLGFKNLKFNGAMTDSYKASIEIQVHGC